MEAIDDTVLIWDLGLSISFPVISLLRKRCPEHPAQMLLAPPYLSPTEMSSKGILCQLSIDLKTIFYIMKVAFDRHTPDIADPPLLRERDLLQGGLPACSV